LGDEGIDGRIILKRILEKQELQAGRSGFKSQCVQTGSGAYRASYPMGTGGSFPRSKMAGA